MGKGLQGFRQQGDGEIGLKGLDFKQGHFVGNAAAQMVLGPCYSLGQASERLIPKGLRNLPKMREHTPTLR